MASAAGKPTIIEQYSQAFTSLQSGKRELIQWGAEAVVLNRYIIDEAEDTGQSDPAPVLQAIDISKVTQGSTPSERAAYCETSLKGLVSLQEEICVLQKSAREKGISGGLLTIIGQAASQSPDDNGASVLRQLTDLVQGDNSATPTPMESSPVASNSSVALDAESLDVNAANDIDRHDIDRMTSLQLLAHTLMIHWKPLVVDASVCAVAAGIAISLIN